MTDKNELGILRAQADMLGVKYHHSLGAKKLKEAIDSHLAALDTDAVIGESEYGPPVYEPPIPEALFKGKQAQTDRRTVSALMRVKIQCMNPAKKDWPGEYISVGSAKLGTFKKYIPFGSGEPYHVPKIIYDMMKDKKCSIFFNASDRNGHKTRKSKLINEYAIELMEPLTKVELAELAMKQAMAAGQDA